MRDLLHLSEVHAAALLHVAAVALGLLLYVALTHSGRQRRAPAAAIGWVVSLVAFPYLALPVYLLLGTRKLAHPRGLDAIAAPVAKDGPWLQSLSHGLGLPPARHCHRIALPADGQAAPRPLIALPECATSPPDLEIVIRADSGLDVPEAELALVLNSSLEIVGYTMDNDVSSRANEG